MDSADAIEQRIRAVVDGMWRTGTVSGTSGTQVVVAVDGASLTLPRLSSYTPVNGDVVVIACPPGAWLVLGKPA